MSGAGSPEPTFDCRVPFADELALLAREDRRVVVVCNDSVGSSNLGEFARQFPDRLVNVGIAEQNMVGVAAGLANGGLLPFVCAAAPFLTARALEQIKVDLAYSKARVVLCGMSPGVAYGELGSTHHSVEDLAWLRAIPDLGIGVPADPEQTRAALRWAAGRAGATYLRIARMKVPALPRHAVDLERALLLREGSDVTIVAIGTVVPRALAAAEELAGRSLSVRVLSLATLRPLDTGAISTAAEETGAIVTVEEARSIGGLGGAVAEWVVQHHPVPMRLLGLPESFSPTGSAEALLDGAGLTPHGIAGAAEELAARARRRTSVPAIDGDPTTKE